LLISVIEISKFVSLKSVMPVHREMPENGRCTKVKLLMLCMCRQ